MVQNPSFVLCDNAAVTADDDVLAVNVSNLDKVKIPFYVMLRIGLAFRSQVF